MRHPVDADLRHVVIARKPAQIKTFDASLQLPTCPHTVAELARRPTYSEGGARTVGTIRKRKWKGRDVFYIDYIAATGERIRQTIGRGEEGRCLARKVLA